MRSRDPRYVTKEEWEAATPEEQQLYMLLMAADWDDIIRSWQENREDEELADTIWDTANEEGGR